MKMILPRQVLDERDCWAAETQGALANGVQAVVRLSARMPAALRTCGLADGPVGRGAVAFEAECRRMGMSLQHLGPGRGALGPWVLWTSDNDPFLLKQAALLVEEGSRQGQLLDLDVYSQDGQISRFVLGLPPRLCVVCGGSAAVCTGRAIHSTSIVQAAFLALLEPGSASSPDAIAGQSRLQSSSFFKTVPVIPQDLRTDAPLALSRP